MKKKNKLLRNQKGSISMFVIVSVLFLTFVLIGIYASYANKLKAQEEQLGKIQGNYGEHASEDGMDNLYIAQTQPPEEDTEDGNTGILPAGYQQVEYIQSTGTQYINTRYIPNSNASIEMKASNSSTANACLYCARTDVLNTTYTAFLINGTELRVDYGSKAYSNIMTANLDTIHIYKQNKNLIYIDGELKKTLDETEFLTKYNMYLMASHQGEANLTNIGKIKLYYCKIWDGGILVRNFVPCYRKSDNVIGLYDIVNNIFYTNSGSGTFTKGNDV